MLHEAASGESLFEENSIESQVFDVMRRTAMRVNEIARGQPHHERILHTTRDSLSGLMRADLQDHPDHIHDDDWRPKAKDKIEMRRSWIIAESQNRWDAIRMEFLAEEGDLELRDLILGKPIEATILSGSTPEEAFKNHTEGVLVGRVTGCSALLGFLAVTKSDGTTAEVALFKDGENDILEQQVLLKVTD